MESLNEYGFKEATAFDGIMPKVMSKLPTLGNADVKVSVYDAEANGVDSLKVVSVNDCAEL